MFALPATRAGTRGTAKATSKARAARGFQSALFGAFLEHPDAHLPASTIPAIRSRMSAASADVISVGDLHVPTAVTRRNMVSAVNW